MITIRMQTSKYKLTVEGHATAEESPLHAEICAGVSALAQALIWSISKVDLDNAKALEYRTDPGNFMLHVFPKMHEYAAYSNAFRVIGDGLELMAKSNPESITFIWDGERILPDKEDEK